MADDSVVLVCRLLIARGTDVCAMGVDDFTSLECSFRFLDVFMLLLAEGAQANVHVLNRNGDLPLEAALSIYGASADGIPLYQQLVADCAPLLKDAQDLRDLGLPEHADACVTAIRGAGWERRLAALRSYVDTNGLSGW